MKNVHVKTIGAMLLLMALKSFGAWGAKMPLYDPHRDGALAELAIVVVDDEGSPVDDASLCVSFATGPVKTAASQRVAELPAQSGFWPKRKATIQPATMWMRNKYRITRRYKRAGGPMRPWRRRLF